MAIQSEHEFAPNQIARAVFPTAFRGYDQDAVRRYLSRLAAALEHQQEYAGLGELEARTPAHERVGELEVEIETLREEIKDLELELVQRSVEGGTRPEGDGSDDGTRASEPAAFDEHRAIELLGQETARVLESARSAAADILKRAETQAASLKSQAKTELVEARKRIEKLAAERQAETHELVEQLTAGAEANAERLAAEAAEHRAAVLEESSKILTEAEEKAESEQAAAEQRAKQIVADAETLRQQVISELVVERRQAKGDMDRMTAARDRLAMALAVARSELDEVADSLVDPSTAPIDGGGATVGFDGHRVIEADAGDATGAVGDLAAAAPDPGAAAVVQELDLRDGQPEPGPAAGSSTPGDTGTRSAEQRRREATKQARRKAPATALDGTAAGLEASGDVEAAAVDVLETETETETDIDTDTDIDAETDADAETESDVIAAAVITAEIEPDEVGVGASERSADDGTDPGPMVPEALDPEALDPDAPLELDSQFDVELDSQFDVGSILDLDADNQLPTDGSALSLVEGFTTIELPEIAPPDGSDGGHGTDGAIGPDEQGDDADRRGSAGEELQNADEVITTVASRTALSQPDRTRGDLPLDEPFNGRLAKEFAARDVALNQSGPNFRRQLRRALNDDQSEVLDRLRAGRGDLKVDELPPFADQIERYLAPLRRGLAEIAQAGARAGGRSDLSQAALDNLVRQLAKYIVDKVRIPTIGVLQETVDQDRERILEPVRAIYRDFRNIGLPDLTEDALYEAFAIGLYDSIEPTAHIRWVTDPRTDPDPVCEINRGRDDIIKGEVFPSGHARPLSLPGCRCLVTVS